MTMMTRVLVSIFHEDIAKRQVTMSTITFSHNEKLSLSKTRTLLDKTSQEYIHVLSILFTIGAQHLSVAICMMFHSKKVEKNNVEKEIKIVTKCLHRPKSH